MTADGRDQKDDRDIVYIEKTSSGWLVASAALVIAIAAILHYVGVLRF